MKPQQALEPKVTEKPIFVEAEKLINRMEEVQRLLPIVHTNFLRNVAASLAMNWKIGFAPKPNFCAMCRR